MSQILTITNKLFSLRGQMDINDETNKPVYVARGEFSFFFSPTWRLFKDGNEVASIKKVRWSITSKWRISSCFGDFMITRKLLSFKRHYTVIGGQFNGATAKGNLFDLEFTLKQKEDVIATVSESLISMRDRHTITVLSDDENTRMFTSIFMVLMQVDKRDGESGSVFSD